MRLRNKPFGSVKEFKDRQPYTGTPTAAVVEDRNRSGNANKSSLQRGSVEFSAHQRRHI